MKRLFLLIPVLALSLLTNATTHEIGSGTSNILGTTVASAADGDVIILTDNGPYVNVWKSENGDDYTRLEKNLTIKAAEGKSPVIKYTVPFRSRYGKTIKFIGIKFDGTEMSHYDYYFLVYNNADNNLEFENCEFTGMSKYLFYVSSGNKAHSIVLNNCSIHDNTNRIVYNSSATIDNLSIVDSEISSSSHYIIHNNGAQMGSCTITNCDIHNCTRRAILNEAGTINNITINNTKFYNFTEAAVIDNYSSSTIGKLYINGTEFYSNTKSIINGAATSHTDSCIINNCYFHNNHKNAVLFEKSTVEGVHSISNFTLTNTTIANNDSLTDYNSQVYLRPYNDADTNTIKVVVDHCTFYNNPTLNSDHSHLRFYKIKDVTITNSIFAHAWLATDVDDTHKYARYAAICQGGTVSNCIAYNYLKNESGFAGPTVINSSKANPSFTNAAEGNFTLSSTSPALMASTNWTNLGAPRWWPTPATLPSTDLASPYSFDAVNAKLIGNIALNENNHIKYLDKDLCGQAAWPIHISQTGAIQATLNMESGSTSGHIFKIVIFDTKGNKVDSIAEPSQSSSDADILLSGTMFISAEDDYIVALYNTQSWSSAKIEGITLVHAGGDVVNIPATLTVDKAWFGNGGTRTNNQISFSNWNNANSWVKWNIATPDNAYCNVKLSISSDNAHEMKVAIVEEGKTDTIKLGESFTEASGDDPIILNLGKVYLPKGRTYIVKVTNPVSGSHAKINSLQFEEISITTINVPANVSLLPATAMLSSKAGIVSGTPDKIDFVSDGSSRKYVANEWARWKINVTANNAYIFTANVTATTGQYYTIQVLSADESKVIGESAKTSDIGSGDKTQATDPFALYAGETYIVKIMNTYEYSDGCVKSISITTAATIDIEDTEDDEDAVIGANDGKVVNAQLTRSLTAGMYNTICLPFAVSAAEKTRVFGDAQVKKLTSSSIEEGGFVLNLNFDAVDEMEAGVPYIIKPTEDISNPKFLGVTIDNTLNNTETSNADFIGNFVVDEIPASEDNLFLGANNTLYFPTIDMEIKGMRAYFEVNNPSGAPIRRARIVEQGNIATEIEIAQPDVLDKDDKSNVTKRIENGQLHIIREGVQYNALGVRVK